MSLEQELLAALKALKQTEKHAFKVLKPFLRRHTPTEDEINNAYIAHRKVHLLSTQLAKLGLGKEPVFNFLKRLPRGTHHWSEICAKDIVLRHGYETLVRDLAVLKGVILEEPEPIDTRSSWTADAVVKHRD